jgi:ribonuclease Z
MTVVEATRVASQAGVRRAVLVHISPRYREEDIEKLAGAAAQGFERAEIGRDLGRYTIYYRED